MKPWMAKSVLMLLALAFPFLVAAVCLVLVSMLRGYSPESDPFLAGTLVVCMFELEGCAFLAVKLLPR
jgi:hypothetical protein